jgi:hypothetical protein
MGASYSFENEDVPAVRRGEASRCPFCGATANRSPNDVKDDNTRIDLVCEIRPATFDGWP